MTQGESECLESSPKSQEEKLKLMTVLPYNNPAIGDPTQEPVTFHNGALLSVEYGRGFRKRGRGNACHCHMPLLSFPEYRMNGGKK